MADAEVAEERFMIAALALMRSALPLLDAAEEPLAAIHLQQAIEVAERAERM